MSRRLSASIGSFRYNRFADFRYFHFLQEVENDSDLLRPLAAGLVWGIDDDLLDELIHDGDCQLRDVHTLFQQGEELVNIVLHFLAGRHPVLKTDDLIVERRLLRLVALLHLLVTLLAQIAEYHVLIDTGDELVNVHQTLLCLFQPSLVLPDGLLLFLSQTAPSITGLPSGTITYGDTFALSAGSGVTWSASGAAAVDSSGKVTVTGAGKVTITATKPGDNNHYAAEDQITFTAVPKALTVTGLTAEDRAYDGTNAVQITDVTLNGIVSGDNVSVNLANLTGTLNGSDVGTYTAVILPRLTLTGGAASNYTLTQPAGAITSSVTIRKAPALTPKTGDLAVANKQEHTYTYGLGALRPDVPEGMSLGSGAVTYELGPVNLGSYYTSGALIDGQTLTLPIDAVESDKAEGIGTITIIIHTGNFEDMTATINVRSVNKIIPTGGPTLSANTLTYGQPLSAITLRGDMADGTTPVPGTFAWSNQDNRPAVQENYAAAWTFKPDDNNKYAIVTGTALIQVLPAPITGAVIVLEPAAFRYDGTLHRPGITSVTLNGTPLTADVDYTAEIPEGTEAGTYTVALTGKGNYTGTATAVFTINPVEQKPLDQKDDDGHELRLEVETGLSTVPEALKTNEQFNTPGKIETALRTRVAEVMSNVGEQIAVFDVTLQYKDESGVWRNVDPNHFPAEGVTAVLPYPAGTGATGYTFTVQHLISSGAQAGTMETLAYTPTADGLQCKFSSLSPVAIGYQTATKPNPQPNPGGNSGGGGWSSSTYAITVEKSEHGKVTSNRTNASNGSTVTLTVTPDSGYVLDVLTVTDSRGNEIKLTAQSGLGNRAGGTYRAVGEIVIVCLGTAFYFISSPYLSGTHGRSCRAGRGRCLPGSMGTASPWKTDARRRSASSCVAPPWVMVALGRFWMPLAATLP